MSLQSMCVCAWCVCARACVCEEGEEQGSDRALWGGCLQKNTVLRSMILGHAAGFSMLHASLTLPSVSRLS